ncbi:MAG: alanine--tRNA ligase [Chlamydiae bacterium CG10_big_fil_rev_8_21_14_0_10_42_34]|nr:MAG: alanine--tRNA ligase [Chlamydiae bacterium CG10_big_fil_rev_8_21_14_0_10_42_34]
MLSQQIRRAFLNYFKSKGHTLVPSSPVIPHDDPTLLFINAGMNQFKDVFLGKSKRDYTRAATTQKCIRVGGKHNDLDNVGHTTRHLTFFEMLGNFSFGDYFKKEAIEFAWDITQNVYGFDPEKVWVSVYEDDDEAFALWEKHLPSSRIVRFGEKENFWSMGDTGPCGPCSELLYDRGEKYGNAKDPTKDASGERYLEFWNLVFMQYSRDLSGKMDPLPKQSIDTGSGLERVVALKMGVDTVFETDILRGLIAEVEKISGKKYGGEPAFHVIADHIRSLSFAIADGVQPSNTDRGYVLRKILRRAVRYGRTLGLQKPFLADILPHLVSTMGEDFPELSQAKARIAEIVTLEEEAFIRTLTRGGQLLGQTIEKSKATKKISGDDAFKLKDTYGLPLDEILLIAKDEHLSVDMHRFEKLEEEAKEKSRKAHKTAAQSFDQNFFSEFTQKHKPCVFEGYDKTSSDAEVIGLVVDGKFVDEVQEGSEALVILDRTPFYAEMGGQVGDTGTIGAFQVYDCTAPFPGVIAHLGTMGKGFLRKKDKVKATIDEKRRKEIQNNHTATHILHWALQQVLGSHIKQAGSLVDDKRLRFDFSHHKAVSTEELRAIENLANEKVRSDENVKSYELSYQEALKRSDIKQFFGEKYGEKVRVIDIDFSKELCGGTHTSRVGTIGLIKIVKESSSSAGVRRIEAVSGKYAEMLVEQEEDLLQTLSHQLKTPVQSMSEKLQSLIEENKLLAQELKTFRKGQLKELIEKCLSTQEKAGSIPLIATEIALSPEDLAEFANDLLLKLKSGVVALGAKVGERCQLLVAVSHDLVQKNISAQNLIKQVAPLIQGGGGGKQNLAQAGGKDPLGLSKALDKIRQLLTDAP